MREMALVMPKLSMTMEDGQVLTWHKSEGDPVHAGEVVCEIMTDKIDMDVESTVDGTLARIVVPAGDSIAVGEPIAYIATESDDLLEGLSIGPGAVGAAAENPVTTEPVAAEPVTAERLASPPSRKGPKAAAPLARRRAAELGIDLATVSGTGIGGAVTKNDVERAAELAAQAKAPGRVKTNANHEAGADRTPDAPDAPDHSDAGPAFADALSARRRAVRRAVASKMTESATVPQFTAYADLDLQGLSLARHGIGWTPLLVHALARTLRDHPVLNSVWQGNEPVPANHVGIALAVDTPVGLIAPVLTDPDELALDELDALARRVITQARNGQLAGDALQGATVTLSNLGGFGVRSFQALVTPPQVCALSIGAIAEAPVGINGALAVRMTCSVGLTVDHRAADGADAGRFLADLGALVATPARLMERRHSTTR